MRYYVLACDYDGTLAYRGKVDAETLAALERLLATGRKLILVTGRELDDLKSVFGELHLFVWVVAENGALLYCPATQEERILAPPPPGELVEALRRRGVAPISVGRSIIATWHPHEAAAVEAIHEVGLEYQIIFNKDAVMLLPTGVNKASGLSAVLKELSLSPHEVVGIGDAENDHAFLSLCECAVGVANALPELQKRVDVVTGGDHGAGVIELVDKLIAKDLEPWERYLVRHSLLIGHRPDGGEVRLPPHGTSLLIAGPSGSGKSTVATSFLERLGEHAYQFLIIDPEGDYEGLPRAMTLGDAKHTPTVNEALQLLTTSSKNVVLNLLGMALADRPPFFASLLPQVQELRSRIGRPHWLIVDEAHHLLPASWQPGPLVFPGDLKRTLFITVHPGQVARSALETIGAVLAVGNKPSETIAEFCAVLKAAPPDLGPLTLEGGEVYIWSRYSGVESGTMRVVPSKMERRRHIRKYAEGELPPERSFYFRGPDGKLNLRAQNLFLFLQLAEGVDDATWTYHLEHGDYSQWFRERIKDDVLADEARQIESRTDLDPKEGRAAFRSLIERHYTLAVGPPLPMPGTDAAPTRQT